METGGKVLSQSGLEVNEARRSAWRASSARLLRFANMIGSCILRCFVSISSKCIHIQLLPFQMRPSGGNAAEIAQTVNRAFNNCIKFA